MTDYNALIAQVPGKSAIETPEETVVAAGVCKLWVFRVDLDPVEIISFESCCAACPGLPAIAAYMNSILFCISATHDQVGIG